MKLLIATGNRNKLREIREKFRDINGLEIISLDNVDSPPDVIEDGLTFEENAVKKAATLHAFTGMAVLADDSGLTVPTLQGRPGIFSARYGGVNLSDEERNTCLLSEMKNMKGHDRDCEFICVIAIVGENGEIHTVKGVCPGVIAEKPSGYNGFGYDPIFFLPGYNKTMAELPLEEKNRISHRAKALEKALHVFREMMG